MENEQVKVAAQAAAAKGDQAAAQAAAGAQRKLSLQGSLDVHVLSDVMGVPESWPKIKLEIETLNKLEIGTPTRLLTIYI